MTDRPFEMLFYTYTLIWLIIFCYMTYVSFRTGRLEKKTRQIEAQLEK
jgi:hypothetical protein